MKNCLWIDSQVQYEKSKTSIEENSLGDSIFTINTSTLSNYRTAQHISNRIDDASKRLQSISKSIHKKNSQQQVKKNQSQPDAKLNPKKLIKMIKQLSEENNKKTIIIEQLQDRIIDIENKYIKEQQKYLLSQSKYIQQINKLIKLLSMKEQDQNKWQEERKSLNNRVQQMNNNLKKKQAQMQKDKNIEIQSLKRQRDEIWKWSCMLNNAKTDKINILKQHLQCKLQDLNYNINSQGQNNKENINNNYNFNGIINQTTYHKKKHKNSRNIPNDDSIYQFLCVQAQSIEKLLQ